MRIYIHSLFLVILTIKILLSQNNDNDKKLQAYIDVLSKEGNDPIDFVIDKFQNHDLCHPRHPRSIADYRRVSQ